MNLVLAITSGLTGAVIAIESIILFIGVRLTAKTGEPWLCVKNNLLVLLDVVAGVALIYFAFVFQRVSLPFTTIFYALIIVSICTHGYREWEYLAGVENRFFFNLPLFVFNNIRLLGLLAAGCLMLMKTREG